MELEQLKNIWPKEMGAGQKQDEYLLSLLGKRSNSPIAQMKRNLMWEFGFVVILYSLGVVYYFFAFEGRMIELAWMLLLLAVVFVVYYYLKNRLLNKMQCVACQVKSSLETQLKTLEKYVKFYLVAGNTVVPLTLIAVGYVGLVLYPERNHESATIWNSRHMQGIAIGFAIVSVIITIASFFLNKWYVNRLYGQHIKKLREMLNDME